MKKLKAFPTPLTQPVNPNQPCKFGEFLECFHDDFHKSCEQITRQEDHECAAVYREIVDNYALHLTASQLIKILGALVAGLYIDPGAMGGQSTNPFMITP
jgi:hypothetical protein